MNIRFEKFGVRFHLGLSLTTKVKGVNSELRDGNHFLMWDFDGVPIKDVESALREVQERFTLSRIYLLNTGLPDFYHAYCFQRCTWIGARTIVAATDHVDKVFFMMGMLRGYFTLRFSKKRGREFSLETVLCSKIPESVEPEEVKHFVEYTTKHR